MLRRVTGSPQRWGLRLATALSTILAVSSVALVSVRTAEATTTPAWPVFTVNAFGATVTDLEPGGTSTTLDVASDPNGIATTPDGNYAYVSSYLGVSVIDGANTATPTARVTPLLQGTDCESVAISPDGNYAYVVTGPYSEVTVISGADSAGPDGFAGSLTDGWRRGHSPVHAERSIRLRRKLVHRNSQHYRWRQYGHSDSLIDEFDRRHKSNLDCDDARRSVRIRVQRGLGNCQRDRQCR